jgi:cytochrome c oxidase subunit 2
VTEPNAPATFQLPEQMSTVAGDVDWLYYFIYWLSVVLFVGIIGAMLYFAWKYRERPGHKAEPTGHNLPLEIGWTVAPIFVLVFLFHKGFQGYMDMTVPPANAMEIKVNAKQWGWEFVYPNGGSDNELHVPVHKAVKLVISSTDVLHSFFVPALRVKRDVVPGMYTSQWFEATHVGQDDIVCAEYCGGRSKDSSGNELPFAQMTGHWSMHSMLHVETPEDFTKYLVGIGDPCASYTVKGQTCPASVLVAQGRKIYEKKACIGCHTTDGSRLVERHLEQNRVDRPRQRDRRRGLRSRIDPHTAGEDRDRLPADDAVLQRPDLRPGDRRGHRLHQVAEGLRKEEKRAWQQSNSRWPADTRRTGTATRTPTTSRRRMVSGRGRSPSTTSASG